MNQAIQFPEREEWDEASGKIIFPVLINGRLVDCFITADQLIQRFGSKQSPLALFQLHRWDLEEEFEVLIEQDLEDELGNYSLSR